jgi:hypothetical protein
MEFAALERELAKVFTQVAAAAARSAQTPIEPGS